MLAPSSSFYWASVTSQDQLGVYVGDGKFFAFLFGFKRSENLPLSSLASLDWAKDGFA